MAARTTNAPALWALAVLLPLCASGCDWWVWKGGDLDELAGNDNTDVTTDGQPAGTDGTATGPDNASTDGEEETEALLKGLIERGLEGLECFTSAHDRVATTTFLRIARKLDLVPTGGSDFHGDRKGNVRLGRIRDGARIPYAILKDIRERMSRREGGSLQAEG